MEGGDLYERIVAAANALYGSHPGRRALHSKGIWSRGVFTASPDARELSRAAVFNGDPVPALVRLSNASGDPESHDAERDGRCMAVKLRPAEGAEVDILATTAPCFVSRTPEDFLELLEVRRRDPATGQPDMDKLGAYLGAHPEAMPAIQSVIGAEPPASFATVVYYSPHTFWLIDADGGRTPVRYRWRPEAPELRIPDDEARARGRDFLQDELADRLRAGTAAFELLLQIPSEDDPLDDSTAIWPDRELRAGGRLEIIELVDDPEGDGHIEVFDPTRIGDGIELSDDPVLHARPKAYSVSAYARLE